MSVVSDSVVWVNPASVPTALTVAFRGTFSETARTGSNGSELEGKAEICTMDRCGQNLRHKRGRAIFTGSDLGLTPLTMSPIRYQRYHLPHMHPQGPERCQREHAPSLLVGGWERLEGGYMERDHALKDLVRTTGRTRPFCVKSSIECE